MKNQWFGDIHDFRKYGLLRFLSGTRQFHHIMVAWMLTPPQSNDPCGKYRSFVNHPGQWKDCDKDLFEELREFNNGDKERKVKNAFDLGILSSQIFSSFGDNEQYLSNHREDYFREMKESYCDLVFLDADNGLEVASMTEKKKKKPQYILYEEVESLYAAGKSVLIYQHRAIGQSFERQIAEKIPRLPQVPMILFRGGNVSYLLLCQNNVQRDKMQKDFKNRNFPRNFLRIQEIG